VFIIHRNNLENEVCYTFQIFWIFFGGQIREIGSLQVHIGYLTFSLKLWGRTPRLFVNYKFVVSHFKPVSSVL